MWRHSSTSLRFRIASLASAEGVTPEIGQMVSQLSDSIRQMGEGSNLLNGLVSGTLLHVPSLPVVSCQLAAALHHRHHDDGRGGNLVAGLQFAGAVTRGHLPDAAGAPAADRQCGGLHRWAGGRGGAAALAAGHRVCDYRVVGAAGSILAHQLYRGPDDAGQPCHRFGGGGVCRSADVGRVFLSIFCDCCTDYGQRAAWRGDHAQYTPGAGEFLGNFGLSFCSAVSSAWAWRCCLSNWPTLRCGQGLWRSSSTRISAPA